MNVSIKHKGVLAFLIVGFTIASVIVICLYEKEQNDNLMYCKEYIVGTGNIKGSVDKERFARISSDFEIGANKLGNAVFKNPENAMKELKIKYASGIERIKNEFDLEELSNNTMEQYKEYGNQVITGTDEERKEAGFVSEFLDIYENSFYN